MSKLYRIYIDESGNHNYSKSDDMDKRFLGLTGVILDTETYETELYPRIINIKKIFTNDLDNLPVLHREEIMAKSGLFHQLNDPQIRADFDRQLLELIENVEFCICAVVIDKKDHLNKYKESAMHPYHYCLTSMLERYAHFLEIRGHGDVMAESRGGVEDIQLKKAHENFYFMGTNFKSASYIQALITSHELKLQPKAKAVPGLELADLLALCTKLDVLHTYGVIPPLTENFNKRVISLLQSKYCRGNSNGRIKGYGKKLL